MFNFLILLLFVSFTNANQEEKHLLNHLFENYDKTSRPVKNFKDPVSIEMGLGVQTLESFNQMEESLALNIWLRSNWRDENLAWYNYSNLTFLSVSPDDIWTPDVELLNAASKPEIYTLKGGLNLYNEGSIMYSKPGIYKYSCSLNLKMFPFDKQNCTMIFGNWIYSNNYVYLQPYKDESKQIDILDSFSHSEWEIETVNIVQRNETRDCCPNEEFNTLYYSFILKRYPHYYKISMGMTITLVVVSFIISLISPDNVSRTGTAVFIPLTILALQLTIADKIPVVGYFTLMDQFFLCCFITSMICSIESGLVYALITTKSPWFFRLVDKLGLCFRKRKVNIIINEEDEVWETDLDNVSESNDTIDTLNNESNDTINTLNKESNLEKSQSLGGISSKKESQSLNRSKSYNEIIGGLRKRTNIINPNKDLEVHLESNIDEINDEEINDYKDVYKVINFDDKRLSLTDKERIIDDKIFKFVIYLDNTIRVILPIVFFSIIIYIFSYEEK
tara:strand:- start:838 stop:2352 length:1515 start_codon:yes stop_codon:yes gene_type:complete